MDGDISIVIGIGAILLSFVIIYSALRRPHRKEVLLLRPRDKRGETLEVTKETSRSVLCENSDPVHRFIKAGSGWVFQDGRRTTVRFFGLEGKAVTAIPSKESLQPIEMPVSDYLQTMWGEDAYKAMPKKLKEIIEKAKVGVLIDFEAPKVSDDEISKLTSEDVNDEGDAIVLNRLAGLISEKTGREILFKNLLWFFLGVGFAAILSNLGWF